MAEGDDLGSLGLAGTKVASARSPGVIASAAPTGAVKAGRLVPSGCPASIERACILRLAGYAEPMRRLVPIAVAGAFALGAATAAGQSAPLAGTWKGTAALRTTNVAVTYTFDGARGGTTRYSAKGSTCRGRLTLRARERGGWLFRDRLVSGRRCTDRDSVFVKPAAGALRVTVHERRGRTTRFTVRKVG